MNNKEIAAQLGKQIQELQKLKVAIEQQDMDSQHSGKKPLVPGDVIHPVPPRDPARQPRSDRKLIG